MVKRLILRPSAVYIVTYATCTNRWNIEPFVACR